MGLMDEMTEAQWAYLAGIVDGEGHLAIGKRDYGKCRTGRNDSFSMTFTVTNSSVDLIVWLANTVGGRFYGKNRKSNWKPSYTWQLQQDEVKMACRGILPYVVVKKEQVLLLLKYPVGDTKRVEFSGMQRSKFRMRRNELYEESLILNQRGVTATSSLLEVMRKKQESA